jgi:hypothetical protein
MALDSQSSHAGPCRLTLPVEGLRAVGRIYFLVAPLFLVASLVEFTAR